MTDLIAGIVGAVIGAIFGVWLLIKHEKKGDLLLDEEIEVMKEYSENGEK